MPAIPLQSRYGPTLGELLAPRWRRASRFVRVLAILAAIALLAAIAAAVETLEPPRLEHGAVPAAGVPSFGFAYRGLYRADPPPGAYALVRRIGRDGVVDSFAVSPLTLAPYRGEPIAALALYAAGYIKQLAARYPGFELRGEGWTQVDSISPYAVYNVFYRAGLGGREMYGRDVLLLPQRPGARSGVAISMLTRVGADKQVNSPLLVGAKGALAGPLQSFALGG